MDSIQSNIKYNPHMKHISLFLLKYCLEMYEVGHLSTEQFKKEMIKLIENI